jgi:hypothetical protein
MTRKKQSHGTCEFCGRELSKGGMSRHLTACPQRLAAIEAANRKSGTSQRIYHLKVQGAWRGDYWLHLEMNGPARLADLDGYLRAIWLECCGHLSHFSIGGWGGVEISESNRADKVFKEGVELTHLYDYGTTSETLVQVKGIRVGQPLTRYPLTLMARNKPPEEECMVCGEPATWLCIECVIEENETGTLCDQHVESHPHDNYGEPSPIVNSPRMGMCGYDGPAEPPY